MGLVDLLPETRLLEASFRYNICHELVHLLADCTLAAKDQRSLKKFGLKRRVGQCRTSKEDEETFQDGAQSSVLWEEAEAQV